MGKDLEPLDKATLSVIHHLLNKKEPTELRKDEHGNNQVYLLYANYQRDVPEQIHAAFGPGDCLGDIEKGGIWVISQIEREKVQYVALSGIVLDTLLSLRLRQAIDEEREHQKLLDGLTSFENWLDDDSPF